VLNGRAGVAQQIAENNKFLADLVFKFLSLSLLELGSPLTQTSGVSPGCSPPPPGRSQDDFIVPENSPPTTASPFKAATALDSPSRYPWNVMPPGCSPLKPRALRGDTFPRKSTLAPRRAPLRAINRNTPREAAPAAAVRLIVSGAGLINPA